MKKSIILVLAAFVLISCSLPFSINWNQTPTTAPIPGTPQIPIFQPTATNAAVVPTAVPTAAPLAGKELNLGGVYMVVPPCLAADATGAIVAAQPYDANGGPMEYWPQHRAISFPGYPLSGKFFEPVLRVYPVAEFTAMNPVIGEDVTALTALLSSQTFTTDKDIPFLPNFAAAQVFHAKAKFQSFQNGQGVRFLTEYAQYYAPVNNHDLFYTFQGLTADGKYWISAIFPVNAAYLQDSPESTTVPLGGVLMPLSSSPNYDAEMQSYQTTMVNMLNNTAGTDFTPALSCLDGYIQSLQIGD
jgi:hypothetical protein